MLLLFFYVGGAVHLASWQRAQARGDHVGQYVWRHVRALVAPAAGLVLTWMVLGIVVGLVFQPSWIRGVVQLVISPMWFLGVYVVLVALVPVTAWLHRKLDLLALVWLGGIAMVVDILRLRYGIGWVGWINMAVVWGLAHQAGFFHQRLVAAARRVDLALVQRVLARNWAARLNALINRFALPLFLFHTTGMAVARAIVYFGFAGRIVDDRDPDLIWWLERPLAIAGPLLCTLPLILLFGHRWRWHIKP